MNKHHSFAIVIVLLGVVSVAQAADAPGKGPTIRLQNQAEKSAFEVVGLDPADLKKLAKAQWSSDQWKALFAVFAGAKPAEGDQPPMLGSYQVEGDVLRFEPRFPLARGVTYRAVLDPSKLPGAAAKVALVTAEFSIPRPKTAPVVIEQVFPTRNKLPENQLRFYFHFSAPMGQGDSYKHIRLLTSSGKEVDSPWLELGEELWDPTGKRFTLFIDPGRIKRGLKPREDLGPVLEEGKTYTIVVDREWKDAEGQPLKESFRKTIQVGPPDDQPIDHKTWKLAPAPVVKTSDPLVVTFPKPLDHALLHRLLWVVDSEGKKVGGTIKVTEEETRWQFTPERPWTPGAYRLVANTILEDLCGNQIGRPFEVDVFKPIPRELKSETVELPFVIQPSPRPR